jgi:glucokinase
MQNANSSIVGGVDIGGSHISAALANLNERIVVADTVSRIQLDPYDSAENIINAWSIAIRKAFGTFAIQKIGIAMPGPFDYQNGISLIRDQNKYNALYGINVKSMLAKALAISADEIRLKNDAACFLQGEVFDGAVKNFSHSVGITLGTGLGSAVYKNNNAENLDLWTTLFKDSIAEDYLSTRWFMQQYSEKTGKNLSGVKELTALIEKEAVVRQIFDEFTVNLEQFLCYIIEKENPHAIVIGGNIANAYPFFGKAVLQTKIKYPFVSIERAALGENAAILGAASLWHIPKTV